MQELVLVPINCQNSKYTRADHVVQLNADEKEGLPGINYTFGRNLDTKLKAFLI